VSVDGDPSPHIAVAELAFVFGSRILLLGVAERPNLVTLDPLAREVREGAILVPGRRPAQFHQQFRHTVFFATPVTRTVARIDVPSVRQATTWARRSVESLFIERSSG